MVKPVGTREAVFGKAAVLRDAVGAQMLAKMCPTATAGSAFAAFDVRVDGDAVTDLEISDARTDLDDFADVFMARNNRKRRGAVVGTHHVDVGVAQTGGTHTDHHIAFGRDRFGQLADDDLVLLGKIQSFHCFISNCWPALKDRIVN